MALITCQARVTSMSPGCSCTGSHHQATGMRVIMTQPSPSCFGPFCTRMSINLRSLPSGLNQKSMAYCFLASSLSWKMVLANQPVTLHPADHLHLVEQEVE